MMKQFIFFLMLLVSMNPAFSQLPESVISGHIYGSFEVGDTSFTLVADANVRDKPSATGAVIAKLSIGTPLKIQKVSNDSLTIKGVRAPWYQVSFQSENKKKSGFLWGGFIAAVFTTDIDYQKNESYLYLGGIASFDEKAFKMTAQLRIAKNGQQLAALEFPTCGELGYHPNLELHGKGSFDNVKQVITFGSIYEACDYANGNYLLFWTKNGQLQKVMETVSSSGAGTGYANETYILPTQRGGINNHILVTEDSAVQEEGKDGEYRIKDQKYKVALWKWNGAKLVKVQ